MPGAHDLRRRGCGRGCPRDLQPLDPAPLPGTGASRCIVTPKRPGMTSGCASRRPGHRPGRRSLRPCAWDCAGPVQHSAHYGVRPTAGTCALRCLAKRLLAEAGYPTGSTPVTSTRCRPSTAWPRPSTLSGCYWHPHPDAHHGAGRLHDGLAREKAQGPVDGRAGASGNAATRIEAFVVSTGTYAYGGAPDLDQLFQQQAVERDRSNVSAAPDAAADVGAGYARPGLRARHAAWRRATRGGACRGLECAALLCGAL